MKICFDDFAFENLLFSTSIDNLIMERNKERQEIKWEFVKSGSKATQS